MGLFDDDDEDECDCGLPDCKANGGKFINYVNPDGEDELTNMLANDELTGSFEPPVHDNCECTLSYQKEDTFGTGLIPVDFSCDCDMCAAQDSSDLSSTVAGSDLKMWGMSIKLLVPPSTTYFELLRCLPPCPN